jgi:hypothetical protein
LKEWKCLQVDHHDNVGGTIEEMEKDGWILHTYAPVVTAVAHAPALFGGQINHYLLFERENKDDFTI